MMRKVNNEVIENIQAKHEFTDPEKLELANRLARESTKKSEFDDQRKQIASDYKAKIDMCEANINSLSNKITSGYEMRETECRVEFDPKNNSKDYFNKKTGEFVERKEMTRSDYELQLDMENEKNADPVQA